MRNKEHLEAKSRARKHLDEVAKTSIDVPLLAKLAKNGFNDALDRLIMFADDENSPLRTESALAVYTIVKNQSLSAAEKISRLENLANG
jgi:hypothetical protein